MEAVQTRVTPEQMLQAMERIAEDRKKVVCNITYAHQVSGEDDAQYRRHLAALDDAYEALLAKVKAFVPA